MPAPEFSLLGEVRVDIDGRSFGIAGLRQRALLAALLLQAGKSVPAEELLEAIWPGQEPARAGNRLPMTASRLRRQLGPPAAGLIASRGANYLIDVDRRSVDLFRFEQAIREGQSALAATWWAQAAECFHGALGLWRDAPLADVPLPALQDAVAHLPDARVQAVAGRVEAELMLGTGGRHSMALRALTDARPFDEHVHGLLMRALYQEGRVAEALEVYRDFRGRSAVKLGLEPGPVLRSVHGAVLTADPSLGARPGSPAPAQLPAGVPDFVGRGAVLELLADELAVPRAPGVSAASGRVAIVTGPGGVGKTALAVAAAHRITPRYAGGVLYADLRGTGGCPEDPANVLASFLHALGIEGRGVPAGLDARAALLRSITAARAVLIVLDDARDSAQTQPLLPGPGGAALITSRSRLAWPAGARSVELGELTADESVRLLARIAGRGRVELEPAAAARVVEACGRLPLAVRIAGARLAARPAWPVEHLAALLADDRHRLDELNIDDVGVRACLEHSYAALDSAAARAVRLLALLDAPEFAPDTAAALLALPEREAERTLEALVDAHLLGSPRPRGYRFHDLTRLYGRELCRRTESESERRVALAAVGRAVAERIRARLLSTRRTGRPAGDRPVGPAADHPAGPVADAAAHAQAWLQANRAEVTAHLIQVTRAAAVPAALSAQMLEPLTRALIIGGFWPDLDRCGAAVLEAALRERDAAAESSARRAIGWAALFQGGSAAESELEQALRLAEEAGDRTGIAASRLALGTLRARQGDSEAAIEQHQAAAEAFLELGIRGNAAVAFNYLGQHHLAAGRPAMAREQLTRGLALARGESDEIVESMALYGLSTAHAALDEHEAAIDCGRRALALAQARQATYSEARAHELLGRALIRAGHTEEGEAHVAAAAVLVPKGLL